MTIHQHIRQLALLYQPGSQSQPWIGPMNILSRDKQIEIVAQTTPAMALGLTDHVWSIGELLDAALAVAPRAPTETAPDRRRRFQVIQGGRRD
jgi:hypothetical protein